MLTRRFELRPALKKSTYFHCGLGPAFDVIGGKWKAVILHELQDRVLRTGELRRLIPGISEKMLAQQLRELERDGIVTRTVHPEVPPRVEYTATAEGRALEKALGPIADWGEAWAKRRGLTEAA